MGNLGIAASLLIALLHAVIFLIEAFQWAKPLGRKIFKLDEDFAVKTKAMAINQGWYNLFLAGGIAYALLAGDRNVALYMLACIAVAGIVGAWTSSPKILFFQTVPALCAVALLLLHL
jgi:putative membrane protein